MSMEGSVYAGYVPRLLLRDVATGGLPPCPSAQVCRGAILFADVSGYTRLAEQLAAAPDAGPDDLSHVLNARLGALVDLVTAHSGDVLKFAGDALIALWTSSSEGERLAVERAAHCAHTMQSRKATSGGVELKLRVGVAAGDVVLMQVACEEGHREVVVGGGALLQLAGVQEMLYPGEVVLSHGAWLHISDRASGEPLLNGAIRLTDPPPAPPPAVQEEPLVTRELDQLLSTFVAPPILPRIDARQTDWLAELRRVTVLFIRLPGLSHTVAPEVAQGLLDLVRPTVHEHGGSIHSISTDDKGIGVVAAFGLPPSTHEDDPVRAIGAALAIDQVLRRLGMLGSIGIATGPAFSGLLGTEGRRQYAVLGEVVNRAARIMMAGGDGPLCDEATHAATKGMWAFQRYPPIRVKGLSQPVSTFRPSAPLRTYVRATQPLVGRESERRLLNDLIAKLGENGGGGFILIEGEAGIGKTRFVESLSTEAHSRGIVVHRATAEAIDSATPYHAWRLIFSQVLGADAASADADSLREIVRERFGLDEEMVGLLPLLNPLLGLRFPETSLTQQMEVEVRARSTQTLLGRMLERVLKQPALLLLENGHWFDSASWALTRHCCQRHPDSLVVLTTRNEPGTSSSGTDHFPQVRALLRLALRPLSKKETQVLVQQRTGEEAPSELVDWIFSRSEGNPLFTEQLVLALQQSTGAPAGREDEGQERLDFRRVRLPDSLQGIILSRVDALPPAPQLCLKVASVFGLGFALEALRSVYPLRDDVQRLEECLVLLETRGLVRRVRPGEYRFQHALIQEATYGLLPLDQRRRLHRAAAGWYERTHQADLPGVYPLLVHHWRGAGAAEELARYLDLAGHQALGSGAYRDAIDLFQEAQLRVRDRTSAQERLEWAIRERWIGEAEYGLGRLAQSQLHLTQALGLLDRPLPSSTPQLVLGVLRQMTLQLVRRLRRPRGDALPETAARTMEACLAYERIAEVGYFLGESLRVFYHVLRNLNLAEGIHAPALAARSYGHMSTFLYFVRARRLAEFYESKALSAARESGNDRPRAHVFEAIALSRVGRAEWNQAQRYAERGAELFLRMGDRRKWAECTSLQLIPALQHLGDFELFERLTEELLTAAVRSGDRQVERWVYYDRASMHVIRGDFEEARRVIRRAVKLLSSESSSSDFTRMGALDALISTRLGDGVAAREAIDGCVQHVRVHRSMAYYMYLGMADLAESALSGEGATQDTGGRRRLSEEVRIAYRSLQRCARLFPLAVPAERRIRGQIEWQLGHRRRAIRAWHQALSAATRREMQYERGLAHLELARHAPADGLERHTHLAHATAIFAGLGAAYCGSLVRQVRDGSP